MSKDPAFLFYSADFLVGTIGMSDQEVGAYIRLLCLQHQKGPMTIEEMERSVPSINDAVLAKFERQPDGRWMNPRLQEEVEKRRTHADLQRSKAQKRWKKEDEEPMPEQCRGIAEAYAEPMPAGISRAMPLENENANGIGTTDKGIKERGPGKTKKGKTDTDQVWKQYVLEWDNHITARTGNQPQWQPSEFQALKKIRTYLEKVAKVPDGGTAEQAALEAWRWVLAHWGQLDTWLKEQTTLRVIGPKITDIINQLKNQKNGKQTTSRKPGIDTDVLKQKIAAAFGGSQ